MGLSKECTLWMRASRQNPKSYHKNLFHKKTKLPLEKQSFKWIDVNHLFPFTFFRPFLFARVKIQKTCLLECVRSMECLSYRHVSFSLWHSLTFSIIVQISSLLLTFIMKLLIYLLRASNTKNSVSYIN